MAVNRSPTLRRGIGEAESFRRPDVRFGLDGGRFSATNVPARELIRRAYGLSDFQLVTARIRFCPAAVSRRPRARVWSPRRAVWPTALRRTRAGRRRGQGTGEPAR